MKNFITYSLICGMFLFTAAAHAAKDTQKDTNKSSTGYSSDGGTALYKRASKLVDEEKYSLAIKVLKEAIGRDNKNADYWNLLGFSSRKLKDYDTASEAYGKALNLDPNHLRANEYLGELYIETDQRDKAEAQLAKLKKLCPSGCEELDMLSKALKK